MLPWELSPAGVLLELEHALVALGVLFQLAVVPLVSYSLLLLLSLNRPGHGRTGCNKHTPVSVCNTRTEVISS